MKRPFWGVILIALGVMALLQGMGQYSFGLQFWDVVLTLLGLVILWHSFERFSWFGLAMGLWIGGIGLFDILAQAKVVQGISGGDILRHGWPLLVVAAGVGIMFGKGPKISISTDWSERKADFSGGAGRVRDSRMVGDVRFGQGGQWRLDKDLDMSHGIGDVKVDLTTADITDGPHTIRVSAWIGDVMIRVPNDVSVTVDATINVGDLEVLGEHRSGFGNNLHKVRVVPDSPVELIIYAQLSIGDLRIVEGPSLSPRILA